MECSEAVTSPDGELDFHLCKLSDEHELHVCYCGYEWRVIGGDE